LYDAINEKAKLDNGKTAAQILPTALGLLSLGAVADSSHLEKSGVQAW